MERKTKENNTKSNTGKKKFAGKTAVKKAMNDKISSKKSNEILDVQKAESSYGKSRSEENRKFYDMRKKNKESKEKYSNMYFQYLSEHRKRDASDYSGKMEFCGILNINTKVFLKGQLVSVYPHKIQGDYSCRIVSNDGREDFVSFTDVKRLRF